MDSCPLIDLTATLILGALSMLAKMAINYLTDAFGFGFCYC